MSSAAEVGGSEATASPRVASFAAGVVREVESSVAFREFSEEDECSRFGSSGDSLGDACLAGSVVQLTQSWSWVDRGRFLDWFLVVVFRGACFFFGCDLAVSQASSS